MTISKQKYVENWKMIQRIASDNIFKNPGWSCCWDWTWGNHDRFDNDDPCDCIVRSQRRKQWNQSKTTFPFFLIYFVLSLSCDREHKTELLWSFANIPLNATAPWEKKIDDGKTCVGRYLGLKANQESPNISIFYKENFDLILFSLLNKYPLQTSS